MRTSLVVIPVATALTAALVGVAGPADAATSHLAFAKGDWKAGAQVVAADENVEWIAARRHLAVYGDRYFHEQDDLTALIDIPLTNTTPAQQATAARAIRELNGFFGTPGLYGVAAGNAKSYAKADWVKSSTVAAAVQNEWYAAAVDELDSYGTLYKGAKADLAELESIPLTDATPAQQAAARRDIQALDTFFGTPGVNA